VFIRYLVACCKAGSGYNGCIHHLQVKPAAEKTNDQFPTVYMATSTGQSFRYIIFHTSNISVCVIQRTKMYSTVHTQTYTVVRIILSIYTIIHQHIRDKNSIAARHPHNNYVQ